MDNRLAGLVIVVAALLFLWLYDTGRWNGIVAIFRGQAVAGVGNQTGAVQSNYGSICAIWPQSCSNIPTSGTTQQPGQQQPGGGSAIGGAIGGALGSIIPGVGNVIGGAIGSIFGGIFG